MMSKKAIILLSGGLDSSTVLAIAHSKGYECYVLTVNYGQRMQAEINAALNIATHFKVKEHKVLNVDWASIGGSALTDESIDIPHEDAGEDIPVTYVPARNTIMLSYALGWAEVVNAYDIFYGANIVDYSNYPDCRPEYIRAFENLANLATKAGVEGHRFKVHAPLLLLSKADIIAQGVQLGVDYSLTISCYEHDATGRACGQCSSCLQRRAGFEAANIPDPTHYHLA